MTSCWAINCGTIQAPLHGNLNQCTSTLSTNQTCDLGCSDGYQAENLTVTCTPNGAAAVSIVNNAACSGIW